jgi:hypothetical protein
MKNELNVLQRNTELKINYYNNSTAYGNIYAEKIRQQKIDLCFYISKSYSTQHMVTLILKIILRGLKISTLKLQIMN